MSEPLNLFFPQWQGSGIIGLAKGAECLYDALSESLSFETVKTSLAYSLTVEENILGRAQILSQLTTARNLIQARNPHKIFTLGGDCSVEIAPVSFLNKKYDQSLALIWLDAHGDLNTPASSPSAHFHGMPLRMLLGEGDTEILDQAFSKLKPEQIFLVGTREFDLPERDFVRQHGLSVVSAKSVNDGKYDRLIAAIAQAGFTSIYIHLDLDVLDPTEFPHVACPTPNGIRVENLSALLLRLRDSFNVVGFSVLEFLPLKHKTISVDDAVVLMRQLAEPLMS